jgi:hypothetical protein
MYPTDLDRGSLGSTRSSVASSTARWTAADNGYSGCDQRYFYLLRTGCQWRLLPRSFPPGAPCITISACGRTPGVDLRATGNP